MPSSEQQNGPVHNGSAKKLNVIVVGGSLGGLTTGIALAAPPLGHNVTILERNPQQLLHNQGAGIVAGGDTLAWFNRYNRCNRSIACTSRRRQYLDHAGAIVHKVDMEQHMTSWDLVYYLLRAQFDGVESSYCEVPERLEGQGLCRHLHGRKVTDLKDEGAAGVRVFYESSSGETGSLLADMVVGADGPSSTVRRKMEPVVERKYAGYVALRGTVPEDEASELTQETIKERFVFFHGPGIQDLAYLIPGINGSTEPGHRLMNFVYYRNFEADSAELKELLTDTDGVTHRVTLPPGKIRPEIWEQCKEVARRDLPPQFAELVCKTPQPFVQAITDLLPASTNAFWGGKVCLIGDALSGFRPHTVASTSQAAFNAVSLANYLSGDISKRQWKMETMQFARFIQHRGMHIGDRSQHEALSLEDYIYDRDVASTPREKEIFPDWTWTEEDEKNV